MLEFLRQLTSGILDAWRRLSINARVQIGLSATLFILILGGAVYMGAQPQLTRAFSNLDLAEAGEIEAYLIEENIHYKVRGGGTAIDVQNNRITDARVALAARGIPRSQGAIPGFEIFDKPDMMANKFLQDVDLTRAYNGELQRQINMFDFVRNSKVFIEKAEKKLFRSEQEPAEAVVTLDLIGGRPNDVQIKAIVHLVSTYGGANLSRRGITIITTDAELLHSPITDDFTSIASDRLGNKVDVETYLVKKLEAMFDGLNRRTNITVTAHLDWSTENTTSKTLGEARPIATLSRVTNSTTSEGATSLAPGVTGNLPEGSEENTGVLSETEETEDIENNEFDETSKITSLEPGRTRKYSVAAVIEGDYGDPADGETTGAYIQLSDELIDQYTKLILASVGEGIEPTDIFVMDSSFEVSAAPAAALAMSTSIISNTQIWQLLQGVLLVVSFFLLRIFIRRAMVLPTVEEEETIELATMSAEELHAREVAEEVARLSREEPETVAALLRNWMAEDQ